VSDPTHIRYGQHLSAKEVNRLIQPTNETIDQIHKWLLESNVSSSWLEYSIAKDWISVTLPVESVEKLLDTKYSVFKHEDGSYLVRTPQWSLPVHIHEHVQTIQPTTSFFRPRAKRSTLKTVQIDTYDIDQLSIAAVDAPDRSTAPKACNATAVTPLCLRTLYGKSCFS
jgi:tripeptidyl-peptidase-1